MKKLFAILASVAVVALLASCEGPMGPPGPAGGINKLVIDDIYVDPDGWSVAKNESGEYLTATIPMPEITPKILNEGLYYTYWMYNQNSIEVREGLGAVMNYRDGNYLWSETLTCTYEVGYMVLNLFYSDYNTELWPNNTFYFRFVAFW
jgi:hypothetical protein